MVLDVPEKLVYSPHMYGPAVHTKGKEADEFASAAFPDNLNKVWDRPNLALLTLALTLTAHRSPLTAHRSPLTAHRSLLTAHRSPLTAHRSPLTAHRSPLTAHPSPSPFTLTLHPHPKLIKVWDRRFGLIVVNQTRETPAVVLGEWGGPVEGSNAVWMRTLVTPYPYPYP